MINKFCNRETITYLICGALTFFLALAVFWLCDRAGMHVAVSNTISTIIAVLFAYIINKIVVFRSGSWNLLFLIREISAFLSGRFATYAGETVLLTLLVDVIGLDSFICKIFTTGLVIIANYLISKKFVFRAHSKP